MNDPGARVHLAVCIPGESMPIESVRCLSRLLLTCLRNPPTPRPGAWVSDFAISEHYLASSMLPYARGWLLDSAVKAGATHILMLDADMTYPADTAHRLMIGTERCGGFVAANCPTRRRPIRWTARGLDGEVHDSSKATDVQWTGVATVGVAVAMLRADLVGKLERPAFNFALTAKGWVGEDVWFSHRLDAAGIPRVVDNGLSREVGHVGAHEFTRADIGATE